MKRSILLIVFLSIQWVNGQSLASFIEEALKNSPEIHKFELQHDIASERVNEVDVIPNTEIGAAYFISEPETRTGAQRFKLSARQMMPWFGSITARENYMSSLADAKYEELAIAKRKLAASVSQSYYTLYALKAGQRVLVDNLELLKTYETMALTSVEVGKASAVDVLRLQIRQNELKRKKQVLEQNYSAELTLFNKLLNRESLINIDFEDLTIPGETDSLNAAHLMLHPELIRYDKLYQSVEQSELLNQKESLPMIGFGLDYIAVSKRPDMAFTDNGKDIVMPMMSLSIPIFNKKHLSKTKQNQLKQELITNEKQDRLNKLETALSKAVSRREAARISYFTQSQNVKQAKDAEELLVKSYETGTINFIDVLDIQELQFKFQNAQIDSVKDFYMQTTIINYLSEQ